MLRTRVAAGVVALSCAVAGLVAGSPAAAAGGVLSGTRVVTIVRVQAFESGVTLDGLLRETDDDSGRQLFVPVPVGGGEYQIKAYEDRDGDALCWQLYNPQTGAALRVQAATCDAGDAKQRFTVTAQGSRAYAISIFSAFLQYSPTRGLILEELGDAPLLSTFRFVDNGPAPSGV